MSNRYKWLLSMVCVCVMVIPFASLISPENSKNTIDTEIKKFTSASGIFIIPPGGKEVNQDTRGRRAVYYDVGDGITILASNPKGLFLINETIPPTRIRGRGLSGRVSKLGKRNYLRFVNTGDKEEKVRTRITLH